MKLPDLSKFRPANHDLGIDLGTCNVLIYLDNQGVVLREPSVVAVDKNTGKILQVGAAARNMMGRTPGNVVAMHPLKDGVISDHELTVKMLQEMFRTHPGRSVQPQAPNSRQCRRLYSQTKHYPQKSKAL